MRIRTASALVLIAGLLGLAAAPAQAAESSAFDTITDHYEAVRSALLHDSLEGIAEHATKIETTAQALQSEFAAERAEVPASAAADCQELLPEIAAAARSLAAAKDLPAARETFGKLSQPLVRYRSMASGDRPVVVYCSMAEKAWLQPEGEIGNPYYGQSMARCGKVVSD